MLKVHKRSRVLVVVLLALTSVVLESGSGQTWSQQSGYNIPPRFKPANHRDNGFTFCRLMYRSVRREPSGSGWRTDYPYADINFMIRLSELTSTNVDFDKEDNPNYWTVRITDSELFTCPFVITSDVGTMGLRDEEIQPLRDYLMKGGFLWVDDFWGSVAWDQWVSEISRVLLPSEYPIVDLPLEHPLFKALYNIWKIPQIANIHFWQRSSGLTSERLEDSIDPHFRAILDKNARIMVVMTHNTDIQDAWEREGEDPRFFEEFAPTGYALGVNVLLHAMSH